MFLGIVVNLLLLGYYKYANFFVDNINVVCGTEFVVGRIILPIGISFFTFQQVAYLVDAFRGETREYNFFHYCLFVSFFPQLIAGPIVHHAEMLPQFTKKKIYGLNPRFIAIGVTMFLFGLFKKVIIADSVSVYSSPVFAAANSGVSLSFIEAWFGAMAYTFQIYFDFSGYSDMAIGLGYLFGIRLPFNFHSPYKATSIVEFWRSWHMTLSRFLRDYLYIPLGGSRNGKARRYLNLFVTMLLGGLWHGAGWTFVVWGALHGVYLVVNHIWASFRKVKFPEWHTEGLAYSLVARTITFFCVIIAWIFFRAENMSAAFVMLKGMLGFNGIQIPAGYLTKLGVVGNMLNLMGVKFLDPEFYYGIPVASMLVALFVLTWFAPNTQQLMSAYRIGIDVHHSLEINSFWRKFRWHPTIIWAVIIFIIGIISITKIGDTSEFLYFQF
jgi:D-alanyl-lipoteichoic acid acyltransferase DltB (MBOAT superfamily)